MLGQGTVLLKCSKRHLKNFNLKLGIIFLLQMTFLAAAQAS